MKRAEGSKKISQKKIRENNLRYPVAFNKKKERDGEYIHGVARSSILEKKNNYLLMW